MAITDVALISWDALLRNCAVSTRKEAVDHHDERTRLFCLILDQPRPTKCHHGTVVGRMIEPAPGEDDAVEVGHRQARRLALRDVPQHPARVAAVPVQPDTFAPEQRRRTERLASTT